MRFTIEQEKLATNIQQLIFAIPAKNVEPMLMNFLLEADAEKQEVKITATDMYITIVVRIQTNVIEEGKTAVSARSLLEIVNSLEDKPIDFRTEEGYLKIHCSKTNFSLLSADHSKFPLIPAINFENAHTVPAKLFAKMVDIASIAVSQEGTRPIFTGILWRLTSDKQLMAATDGKKIAEVKKSLQFDITERMEQVIPPKGLHFIQKVVTESNQELKFIFEENRVYFSYKNYKLICQVVEGRFPQYEKVLEVENPYSLLINKDILKQAVKRVALLSTEDFYRIKMDVSEERIIISSFNFEIGDAAEEITDFDYNGPGFSIAFNYKFILSTINVIETDKIKITFAEPKSGIVNDQVLIYNHPDLDEYAATILIMPLRLK